ncbi:MAG: MBOAT family protein [Sphingomonas sp.]|uniref:MBOAT family O-acyltransferase n=1 Tax=Sphingomonas sp. TaxID=28214 RepID=UPI001AC37F6B|nr:MBOAT family O-acyltransferase [Sphingomonas sp.]MBN8814154.1 MBOAT family protein [Sphingomonas sp.]
MLFNSLTFAVFLPVVYALYRVLPFRAQNYMLLAASYLFYGWWDWRFLFLMIVSTCLDFWTGLILERAKMTRQQVWLPLTFLTVGAFLLVGCNFGTLVRTAVGMHATGPIISTAMPSVLLYLPLGLALAAGAFAWLSRLPEDKRRKYSMILSMCVNLAILGTFKYFNFFVDSAVTALNDIGIAAQPRHFDIVLPVGISFYTFQSMSYAIDIYKRELKPVERFLDFGLFVAFFPQLVAGPIERARHLLPQIIQPRTLSFTETTRGLFLILLGLFKKIAIADGAAMTVDQIFNSSGPVSWLEVVVGTILFAVQIYTDFSGYSDIARGTAKLFGVDIMVNFRLPYFARSPRDFWNRWHISLSTWLGDYLYKPLGGNRGSMAFTCRNLMLTMLLGGLWHGAAWNYILWGAYHGTALSAHRVLTGGKGRPASPDGRIEAVLKTLGFGIVTLYGWLLFRAHSFDQIATFTRTLLTGAGGLRLSAALPPLSTLLGIVVLATWEIGQYRAGGDGRFYQRYPAWTVGFAMAAMAFLLVMGSSNAPAQFIYFQF